MRTISLTVTKPVFIMLGWLTVGSTAIINMRAYRITFAILAFVTVIFVPQILEPVKSFIDSVFKDMDRASRNEILLGLLEKFPKQTEVPYSKYQLNVARSNMIPLDREVPDTRNILCHNIRYDTGGYDVSIIIPFHDESWSMLLRALHSILDNTPEHMLKELILIDDQSTYQYTKQPLLDYVSQLSAKIRLFRNFHREGLIRSRVRAAKVARGKVLVFLDAHVEVNKGWLEPLLNVIKTKHGKALVVPHIDSIDPSTIEYNGWEQEVHGGFSWSLEYVWKYVPNDILLSRKSPIDPIKSATTIGCAMIMERQFFFDIGAFDEGMYIWGGENIEISFRTWMCGGEMLIVPCSRVAHVFRKFLPYYFPFTYGGNETTFKNYQRVADVWMDEYKKYYYASTHLRIKITKEEQASLNKRHRLRAKLQCKPFAWFLDTILPEMGRPPLENVTFFGEVSNLRANACFTRMDDEFLNVVPLTSCGRHHVDQTFHVSSDHRIKNGDGLCISANKSMKFVQLLPCFERPVAGIMQKFSFDTIPTSVLEKLGYNDLKTAVGRFKMVYRSRKLCVEQVTYMERQYLFMNPCNDEFDNNFQLWSFSYAFEYNH